MNDSIIYIFILIANVVAILSTYLSFGKRLGKDKKMLYTMIAIGVIYIITLGVYFFSSLGIKNSNVSSNSKNMITFSFVPVNVIIILPFLIRSFEKAKDKIITNDKLNKRVIIALIIGIVLIFTEFFYFRNIQKNIIDFGNKITEQNNEK